MAKEAEINTKKRVLVTIMQPLVSRGWAIFTASVFLPFNIDQNASAMFVRPRGALAFSIQWVLQLSTPV